MCAAGTLQPCRERGDNWSTFALRDHAPRWASRRSRWAGQTDALDVLRTAHRARCTTPMQTGECVAGMYSSAQDAAYRRRFTLLTEFGNAL
jgi:hypothetical protein